MNFPEIPPTPLCPRGGEGGFLKFVAILGAKSFLSAKKLIRFFKRKKRRKKEWSFF
jgi:hypothetical protein